jgi:PTH1 family peptidyl-tRNA hydrolase
LRIIFGIGNPGIRYKHTRHNAGFLLLDHFARKKSLEFTEAQGEYLVASGRIDEQDFSLIKPTTFVNNSGIAAKQIFEKYSFEPENFLVVCDDTNLKSGSLRVRLLGGDGGHNGLNSIIYHLATENFPRIRIGIGSSLKPEDLAEYVLSEFSESEFEELNSTFNSASLLIEEFIIGGNRRMLEVNSKISGQKPEQNSGESE